MQRNYVERLAMPNNAITPKLDPVRVRRVRQCEQAAPKDFKLGDLAMLSITPVVRSIQRWWLRRAERHYLMCAHVEEQRAREAHLNSAYYQKRAAMARSAQI